MKKLAKGIAIGTLISVGIAMMWSDDTDCTKRKMMKKGKQFMKNMGMM